MTAFPGDKSDVGGVHGEVYGHALHCPSAWKCQEEGRSEDGLTATGQPVCNRSYDFLVQFYGVSASKPNKGHGLYMKNVTV